MTVFCVRLGYRSFWQNAMVEYSVVRCSHVERETRNPIQINSHSRFVPLKAFIYSIRRMAMTIWLLYALCRAHTHKPKNGEQMDDSMCDVAKKTAEKQEGTTTKSRAQTANAVRKIANSNTRRILSISPTERMWVNNVTILYSVFFFVGETVFTERKAHNTYFSSRGRQWCAAFQDGESDTYCFGSHGRRTMNFVSFAQKPMLHVYNID